jgi:predicted porin
MSFNRKPLVVCCSLLFGFAGSARADQMSDMQSQLEALQRQIQQLQSQMEAVKRQQAAQPVPPPPGASANFIKPGKTLTFEVAGSTVQIYGHVDVSADDQTNGMSNFMNNGQRVTGNNGWVPDVSSNLSYFGIRGSRNLGADLRGLFQFETEVSYAATPGASDQGPDATAQKYALGSRDSYVGLGGTWGAVKMGKMQTPYKTSTARLDPFRSTPGDYNAIIGNSGGDNRTEFDLRLPHSVWYESPKYGPVSFSVLASPGQNRSTDSQLYAMGEPDCAGGNSTGGTNGNDGPPLVPAPCEDGSFKDAYSASLMYQAGPLYATVAYELHKNVNRRGDEIDPGTVGVRDESAYKLGVQYRLPTHTTLNFEIERMRRDAIVQDFNERTRTSTWFAVTQGLTPKDDLNLAWAHAGHTPGQPAQAVQDSNGNINPTGPSDNGANLYDIGWKHHFDSQTSIYFVYARLVNEHWGHFSLGAGGHGLPTRNYVGDKFNGGCADGGNCGLFTGNTAQAFSVGVTYDF